MLIVWTTEWLKKFHCSVRTSAYVHIKSVRIWRLAIDIQRITCCIRHSDKIKISKNQSSCRNSILKQKQPKIPNYFVDASKYSQLWSHPFLVMSSTIFVTLFGDNDFIQISQAHTTLVRWLFGKLTFRFVFESRYSKHLWSNSFVDAHFLFVLMGGERNIHSQNVIDHIWWRR